MKTYKTYMLFTVTITNILFAITMYYSTPARTPAAPAPRARQTAARREHIKNIVRNDNILIKNSLRTVIKKK